MDVLRPLHTCTSTTSYIILRALNTYTLIIETGTSIAE